jgi:hypothetical protein
MILSLGPRHPAPLTSTTGCATHPAPRRCARRGQRLQHMFGRRHFPCASDLAHAWDDRRFAGPYCLMPHASCLLPPASPPQVAVQSFAPKPQHHLPTQPRRKAPAPSRAEPVGSRQNTAAPDGQRLLEPAAQRTLDRATQHRSPPGGRLWALYGGLVRLGVPHARLACPR